MGRLSFSLTHAFAAIVLAGAVLAPVAAAQAGLRGKQPGGGLPSPAQSTTTSGLPLPAHEPKDLDGMLAAQNEARRRLNLAPLAWSATLAAKAIATASDAALTSCSKGLALKAGEAADAAIYWAAGIPHSSGGFSTQTITPSFLVSEWQAGRGDYDPVAHECRSAGACQSWARMVAPAAREVGCARVVCPSQGQVWVCHYDTPKLPDLRRRADN